MKPRSEHCEGLLQHIAHVKWDDDIFEQIRTPSKAQSKDRTVCLNDYPTNPKSLNKKVFHSTFFTYHLHVGDHIPKGLVITGFLLTLGSGECDLSDHTPQLRRPSEDPPLPDLVSDRSVRTPGVCGVLDGPCLFRDAEIDKVESCMDLNI